jgi:hypothetical protein
LDFVTASRGYKSKCTSLKANEAMKQLTWKLVLPLTIISFGTVTKWWDVKVDDYGETLKGFPFPFVCPGWHTSLSLQIFVLELIVDVFVYFAFWFSVTLIATKSLKSFQTSKSATIVLLTTSGLFMSGLILFAINRDNIYSTTRPFDIEIKETGYHFMWE